MYIYIYIYIHTLAIAIPLNTKNLNPLQNASRSPF